MSVVDQYKKRVAQKALQLDSEQYKAALALDDLSQKLTNKQTQKSLLSLHKKHFYHSKRYSGHLFSWSRRSW